jgi:uncharacterized membrane protein YraQ (UPF0718 family)/YHS domain-containing protein
MFWQTLWALVLGFGLSGAVQAFVSREAMGRHLGNHRPAAVARASLYGMASSSCSYAASAMARSMFARGADFLASMVFMFASTNLVIELGIVLAILIGWQFVAAELVGGVMMIVLLVALGGLWFRGRALATAQGAVEQAGAASSMVDQEATAREGWRRRIRSWGGWADAASYAMSDLTMLRRELVIGFLVAGFLTVVVPTSLWSELFLRGHGIWTALQNAAVGPLVAIISFVCSVGNVPLAAALWRGGISFGGVVAFIFADLITFPLLLVYRKQYGRAMALRMLGVFWLVMSAAGLATESLFRVLGWVPRTKPGPVVALSFRWGATSILDVVALVIFAGLYVLHRSQERLGGGRGYARDPVCKMQVEIAHAPGHAVHEGVDVYFCSEHCQERFSADPTRFPLGPGPEGSAPQGATGHDVEGGGETPESGCCGHYDGAGEHVDPMCGMTVTPASAAAQRDDHGTAVWFCSTGCAEQWDRSHSVPVQFRSSEERGGRSRS